MTESLSKDCLEGKLPFPVKTPFYWFLQYHYAGRPYHNFRHIEEMIANFNNLREYYRWYHLTEVAFAILFHDIIYVPGAKDNEAKSIEVAKECIPKFYPKLPVKLDFVAYLIDLTASHGKIEEKDIPISIASDVKMFLDCDMAILGAKRERFLEYETQIALEYSGVPEEAYLKGRRRFLANLLAKRNIFLSEEFRWLELQARHNIIFSLTGVDLSVP